MIRRTILLTTFLFTSFIFAQDPGIGIEIRIIDPQLVTGDALKNYQVKIIGTSMHASEPNTTTGTFEFFSWDAYREGEVLSFEILHKQERMQVVFEVKNMKELTEKEYFFNSRFIFEVPFSPGCYSVTKFGLHGIKLTMPSTTRWKDLKCDACCETK